MSKIEKITAAEARFPLASLKLSPLNPRQEVPEADVIELAQSILAAGLIQNLAGLRDDSGAIEIVAGGRRLRALQYLAAKDPKLSNSRPELANPLVAIAPDEATARLWANLENVARRDLHPAEEIRAYGKMEEAGSSPAMIARAFAVTEKHVYRRLALAKLPTAVLDALAANEINLSAAACFTVCDDEELALTVLQRVKGSNYSDHHLKNMLSPQSVTEKDRRAVFVGMDAYKAAGGSVTGDLFAEILLLNDVPLLDRLFTDKLDAAAADYVERTGAKWAECQTESYLNTWDLRGRGYAIVRKVERELSDEQCDRFEELNQKGDEEELEDAEKAELEALHAEMEGDFSDAAKPFLGAFVFANSTGELQIFEGVIRSEDFEAAIEVGVLEPQKGADCAEVEKSPISAKLADDLRRVVTGAKQHAALRHPDLMIALLAFQFSHKLAWSAPFGMELKVVHNMPTTEQEGYALDDRLTENLAPDMWSTDIAERFKAFRAMGADHVQAELMRFLAGQYTGGDRDLAALVEDETAPDIRSIWTPTAANFFSRVGGPYLVSLWRDLLGLSETHPTVTTFEKLKKSEKAEKLEALFSNEAARKALGVTAEQAARIAAWLPEGM